MWRGEEAKEGGKKKSLFKIVPRRLALRSGNDIAVALHQESSHSQERLANYHVTALRINLPEKAVGC